MAGQFCFFIIMINTLSNIHDVNSHTDLDITLTDQAKAIQWDLFITLIVSFTNTITL